MFIERSLVKLAGEFTPRKNPERAVWITRGAC
jgi:hypothetical protein